jgi:uncharacterized cupredoxin-like copper-binding protein
MKYSRTSIAALAISLVAVLAGCGQNTTANTAASGRVIDTDMTDNAYSPKQLQVAKGETVTLRFHNKGMVVHEAVIGDDAMQASHHQQMTASTGMTNGSMPGDTPMATAMGGTEHGNMNSAGTTDDDAVTVQPGQMKDLKHAFTESGTVLIGCHEPGHWEAGMKATITVQ